MTLKRGYLVTVEGIEGVGKSTAIHFLRDLFDEMKIPCLITREPGGTPVAEAIRQVLLQHYEEHVTTETELLLLFAARSQNLTYSIKPALARGEWVICDRFTDASYAYQGAGRGIDSHHIEMLENWIQGDLRPDLVLVLDAPVKIALERMKHRSKSDRIEVEKDAFFERVRKGYLARAKDDPERYKIIHAERPLSEVKTQIKDIMNEFIQHVI